MKKLTLIFFALLPLLSAGAQKWETPDWSTFHYPEIDFINKAEQTEGWKIYKRIVPNPEEFIQQHALWVAQTLYWSPRDTMQQVKKIEYFFEDREGISAKGGTPPVVNIFYSSRWVEHSENTMGDDKVLYETRGVLYHELTHAYQLEPQGIGGYVPGTEYWAFIEGMADAVRYHNGFFPVDSRKPGGHWLDGYRTTGFFLQWLTGKDPDFLRKFNRTAIEIIPWSFDKAMQSIFGNDITTNTLWKEYQDFLTFDPKATVQFSGNPAFPGWYADPEGMIYDDTYYIYPTTSDVYEKQTFFDCFSSKDLVHWEKHHRILDNTEIKWAHKAMWAPSVIRKDGKYYFFFGANDIQNNDEPGGIGVAVADRPEGPYKDLLGKPLIDKIVNGAQPIDQFVFRDKDGTHYLYYGGWGRCNVVKLKDDFTGLVPFENGEIYREVTPEGYTEGPFMFIRNGKYYFMWSEGGWGLPNYSVAYAIADSPFGPFKRVAKILEQDADIATSAGHHSLMNILGTDEYYIVYHRRPLPFSTMRDARMTCIEKMTFDEKGFINPVKMTFEGVSARPIQ